jgi:ribosomal protein S11
VQKVAAATAAQLAAQTAQLEEIQKGVQEVDVNLKLAGETRVRTLPKLVQLVN